MTVDIAGLRALIAAATPGPWEPYGAVGGPPGVESLDNGHTVAEMFGCDEHPPNATADAAFVAAARTALPAALDEIERLQAELTSLSEHAVALAASRDHYLGQANRNARLAADMRDERDTAITRERERIANWFTAEGDMWRIKNATEAQCEYDRAAQMVRDSAERTTDA